MGMGLTRIRSATAAGVARGCGLRVNLMESEEPSLPVFAASLGLASQRLFEHEVSNSGFEVRINYRDRREIERSMGTHHHLDPAGDCEDRAKDEPRDHRLFNPRKPEVRVMAQGKQSGGEQDEI